MIIIVNSVYPAIGTPVIITVRKWWHDSESEGECHLIPEVSPCVSTQERPSMSLDCFLPKVRLHFMSQHYRLFLAMYTSHTYTHTHTYDPASVLFLGSAYGGPSASSASRLSLNWMQVRDASLPQWNCDVAAWFWVPCIFWYLLLFFLEKVEETGWMEASGSVAHLQVFRPLACWRWIECPGLGSKVTQFPITHSKGMVLPDEWSLLRRRS